MSTNSLNCGCQTVSGLTETVVEKVVLTQEDSLKKNSGKKKKNRERGKVKFPRSTFSYNLVCPLTD